VLVNLQMHPPPTVLLGSGKVGEMIETGQGGRRDVIVIDETLSPAQQRNWETESCLAVIDRQEVILEVFADPGAPREPCSRWNWPAGIFLPAETGVDPPLPTTRPGSLAVKARRSWSRTGAPYADRIAHLSHRCSLTSASSGACSASAACACLYPRVRFVGYTNAGKSCSSTGSRAPTCSSKTSSSPRSIRPTRQLALPNTRSC